jgi:lysophospholipid acyltransferase (LPLAT)-like uncharacterized protein
MIRPVARWTIVLLARLYRVYAATLRIVVLLPDGSATTLAAYPFGAQIFALSERDTVALAGIMAGRRFSVLVACGRDGDWATVALEALGCTVIRGSSRGGGVAALVTLIGDRLAARGPAALVVDGPLGPLGVAKSGVAVLAARTGLPICTIGAAARRRLTLARTWAQIYIPLPFTRVAVALEEIASESSAAPADLDRHAAAVTRALARARVRAQQALDAPRQPAPHPEGARG